MVWGAHRRSAYPAVAPPANGLSDSLPTRGGREFLIPAGLRIFRRTAAMEFFDIRSGFSFTTTITGHAHQRLPGNASIDYHARRQVQDPTSRHANFVKYPAHRAISRHSSSFCRLACYCGAGAGLGHISITILDELVDVSSNRRNGRRSVVIGLLAELINRRFRQARHSRLEHRNMRLRYSRTITIRSYRRNLCMRGSDSRPK